MQTDEDIIEHQKRVIPGYAKFLAIPEEEREAYVLGHVNEARMKEGMPPLDRLMTVEEHEAARKKGHEPAPKPTFRQRFRRAWAILWTTDN